MYAEQLAGLGDGITNATDLPPIDRILPYPLPAGPGQQVVTIYSQGLREGFNLSVSPVDYAAITNSTTQGYGAPLYDVSPDGTSAKALIDLRGNVAQWSLQVISPYTNQQSPELRVWSVAGAAAPFDFSQYAFESGQLSPVLVVAETRLVAQQDANGVPTNYIVVTGGSSGNVLQPDGSSRSESFPSPGILVNDPGAWRFIPAGPAAAAVLAQRLPSAVPLLDGSCYNGMADAFGLPIVTPTCPGDLAWIDLNGNPVTSPWSTGQPPILGSPIQQDPSVYYGVPSPLPSPAPAAGGGGGGGQIAPASGPTVALVPYTPPGPVLLAPSPSMTPAPQTAPTTSSAPDAGSVGAGLGVALVGGLFALMLLKGRRR